MPTEVPEDSEIEPVDVCISRRDSQKLPLRGSWQGVALTDTRAVETDGMRKLGRIRTALTHSPVGAATSRPKTGGIARLVGRIT